MAEAYLPFAKIKSNSVSIFELFKHSFICSVTFADSTVNILSISAFYFSINSFITIFKLKLLIGSINKVAPVEL